MINIKKNIITEKEFYREAIRIFIPVVLQSCINQGVNMMDTIMVGSLGEVAISASSLANQYYTFFNLFCMGLSGAGLILTAQFWGASDRASVKRVTDFLIQLIFASSTIFAVITFIFPQEIMSIYTTDLDVRTAGAAYLRITAFVFFPHGISLVLTSIMRSVGNARLGLYTSVASFFINIFCNYLFIYGKFGFPAMGVAGAAWGTLCARLIEFAVCCVFVLKTDSILRYRLEHIFILPDKNLIKKFLKYGLPVIIGDTLLSFSSNAVSMILGHMGKEFVSSYSIVTVIERMCTLAAGGAGSAASVMVGHMVGANEKIRAVKAGYSFLLIGSIFGVIGSVLILFLGEASIALYSVSEYTVTVASSMMIANAFISIFQTLQNVLGKGVLRGGGDTKFVMFTDVIFQWCASIPLGYLAGIILGASPFIVLLCVRIDYVIKAVIYIFRIGSGKWINNTSRKAAI